MENLFAMAEQNGASIKRSLGRVVKTMRGDALPYREAVHRFEVAYISQIRKEQAGHLGKTAAELGMHHNTLTRILRSLQSAGTSDWDVRFDVT